MKELLLFIFFLMSFALGYGTHKFISFLQKNDERGTNETI